MEDNTKYQEGDDRLMDEMFRENLSDNTIEPSSGVWKNINRKLLWKEIFHFNFTNLTRAGWIGGVSLAIIITAASYLIFRPGVSDTDISSLNEISSSPVTPCPEISAQASVLPATPAVVASLHSHPPVVVPNVLAREDFNAASVPSSSTSRGHFIISGSDPKESTVSEDVKSTSTESGQIEFFDSKPANELSRGAMTDTLRIPGPGNQIYLVLKEKIPSPKFFSVNLSVLPELTFYKTPDSYSEVDYWMNLGASYHLSRFSIGTGISLGYVYDEGKYRIEYKSKDSIGFYESVVGFTVNPQNASEIIYQTELKNVYDSVQHIADDRTRNRYTYLQIPLLLGYRFVETQHLGITLQVGPAVSFLIGKKEAKPYIDYPNARIIRIENNTSNRISTSWQLWLSLRIDYRINKMISIFAEPSYKYTVKTFETSGEGSISNANSIGFGIGMQFYFGKK